MPDNDQIAEARRRVTDPHRVNLHPALMADAFFVLLEARGGRARFETLGPPCHRIGPAQGAIEAPMAENVVTLPALLEAACARTRQRVRQLMPQPTGGDAA